MSIIVPSRLTGKTLKVVTKDYAEGAAPQQSEVTENCKNMQYTHFTFTDGTVSSILIDQLSYSALQQFNLVNENNNWVKDLASVTVGSVVSACIDDGLFLGQEALSSVQFRSKISTIRNGIFSGCISLSKVTLPDGLESIGQHAFFNCHALSSLEIPCTVKTIGESALGHCNNISSLQLPYKLKSIKQYAFQYMQNLKSIAVPNGVEEIGQYAFAWCYSLSSAAILGKIKALEPYTFGTCSSLVDVVLPDTLNTINNYVFSGCTSLTGALVLPESIQTIKSYAFRNTSFSKIVLKERTSGPTGKPWGATQAQIAYENNCTKENLAEYLPAAMLSAVTSMTDSQKTAFKEALGL